MSRRVLEPANLDEVAGFIVSEPVRFIFRSPLRGGPRLADIRRATRDKGIVRFSGSPLRLFVDIDPGAPEEPVVAMDGIVRSDAKGIERAILSALPHVDEIVIGVDGRSDDATRKVVEAYADTPWAFEAADIGLSEEDWKADRIHFANARNMGRERVKAPWSLFLDSDEYIHRTEPVREVVRRVAPNVGAFLVTVQVDGYEQRDCQRLARSGFRWISPSHNQLISVGSLSNTLGMHIVHDPSIRATEEQQRRAAQRTDGVDMLVDEVAQGNLIALFHLAKHKLAFDPTAELGLKLVDDFRKQTAVHSEASDHRVWLALAAAAYFYNNDKFTEAELWCLRAMLDGPRIEALCILGDIAEDTGHLEDALTWYEMACVTPVTNGMVVAPLIDVRWGRREGLRRALGRAAPELYPGVPAPVATSEDERVLPPEGEDETPSNGHGTEPDGNGAHPLAAESGA